MKHKILFKNFILFFRIFILLIIILAGFLFLGHFANASQPYHLWHFNECDGQTAADFIGSDDFDIGGNQWTLGKWNCGLRQYYKLSAAYVDFNQPIDANNLTISFYYKFLDEGSRFWLRFINDNNQALKLVLSPFVTKVAPLLHSTAKGWPADNQWHFVVLTVDGNAGEWKLYLDANEFYGRTIDPFILPQYTKLEIKGNNNYNYIDEVALWQKTLSQAEIETIYQSNQEFEPASPELPTTPKKLLHLWNFDEGSGDVIHDLVGETDLNQNAKWGGGKWGSSLYQSWQDNQRINSSLSNSINSRDVSIDFWWKNSSYPDESRGRYYINGPAGSFGVRLSTCHTHLYTPRGYISISPPSVFFNNQWHHIALVYNSYDYQLSFYVDAQLVYSSKALPIVDTGFDSIHFHGENSPYNIDEFAIWQGALSQQEIEGYYNSGQPHQESRPTIEFFNQFKSDKETELYEQEITAGDSVVFKATIDDPDGDQVKLQVEVKEYPNLFMFSPAIDDDNLLNSDFVDSGSEATVTTDILVDGKYHWRARAVDEKGNASDWQYFGYGGPFDLSFDFEIKTVPLYTQVVSDYPFRSPQDEWAGEEYAKGDTQNYWCGSEIKDCGCAITSAVMTLRYHNITEDVEDNDINPGIINQWLKNATTIPIGYYSGNINWIAVEEYARDYQTNKLRIVFNGKYNRNYKSPPYNNHQEIKEMLDDDLESYQPVIVRDDRIGHFFVATEELAHTYRINDPLWYNTKTLNQKITQAEYAMPYDNYKRDYDNHYGGIRRFYALGPYDVGPFRFASLDFVIASPAELLVTYFDGLEIKKLGKDPISGKEYNEIPGGSYISEGIGNPNTMQPSEHQIKSIWIPDPGPGDYKIKVIGTGEGDYTFYSTITDLDGNSQAHTFTGNTQTNLKTVYDLNYNPEDIEETEIILSPDDITPPEAKIYFDPDNKEFVIAGIDDFTASPTITQDIKCAKKFKKKCEYIYIIADEAGNTLKLRFTKSEHKHRITAKLKEIQYNDNARIKKNTKISYVWTQKRKKDINFLSQNITDPHNFFIEAVYWQKKDKTVILKDKKPKKKTKQILNGLVIVKLLTQSGELRYDY